MKLISFFYCFTSFFIMVTTTVCFGQIPVIEWQKEYGPNQDKLSSMQATFDGGYILGGSSSNGWGCGKSEPPIGGPTCGTNPCNDYWVVKINASGQIEWENTIGGYKDDNLQSVIQTSDGGYFLGGYSDSNLGVDKTENRIGTLWEDYWVVKLDGSGIIQWENTIGGESRDKLFKVLQTYDGGYILGGYSSSDISGDKTSNCKGGLDYWIIKLNAFGSIEWQQTIGSTSQDNFGSLQETRDHGFVLSGQSYGKNSGDKSADSCDSLQHTCYWIVKLDERGNIQWDKSLSGTSNDIFPNIIVTSDNGFLIGGSSDSHISCDKTENHCINATFGNDKDYWIIKLDSSGIIQWDNTIGGAALVCCNIDDILQTMIQTIDGGYIVGGFSVSNISCDKTENSRGNYDYWIVKIDSSGLVKWDKTIGGLGYDELFSIENTDDNGYILGGWSTSDISGDKTINPCGGENYWVVKLATQYNNIKGKLYIDANSNQVKDSNDVNLSSKLVSVVNTSHSAFSKPNGFYNLLYFDTGSVTIIPQSMDYYTPVPPSRNINFSGFLQIDSLNDFALQPSGVYNDLCVSLSAFTTFSPGFSGNYQVTYENVGTTSLNGTIVFYPDSWLSYQGSNIVPVTISTDSVVWDVGLLNPFQQGSFYISVNLDSNVSVGSTVYSSVVINPVAGDANAACNYASWGTEVTGSFDPNAMVVNLDTLSTEDFPNPPGLEYIIYFQNTGNDTAFNVKVLNSIPAHLDANSFELVSASHPVKTKYNSLTRKLEFRFDNIVLPDSNVNEMESHGFIHYKIKPLLTLKDGDIISNMAYIFFDFNQPIHTNQAKTLVYSYCKQFNTLIVSGSSVCSGDTISAYNGSLYTYSGNFQWYLDSALLSTDSAVILTGLTTGVHWLTLNVDTLSCHASSSQHLKVNANPQPAFTISNDSLIALNYFFSYQWLLNNSPMAGATKSSFVFSQSGWYSLSVNDYNLCSGITQPVYISYTGIVQNQSKHVTLFPNPSSEKIRIHSQEKIYSIKIFDLPGREVYSSIFNDQIIDKNIDVSAFQKGIYIAEIKTGNYIERIKFIRE